MLGLDFRPFHLLLRWRNAHLAQPNSAFAALNQAKIIENRLASPKSDRLLEDEDESPHRYPIRLLCKGQYR